MIPLVGKLGPKFRNFLAFLAVSCSLALVSYLAVDVLTEGVRVYTLGANSPSLTLPSGYEVPVRVVLEVDGLNILMALTSSLIAFVGTIYSFAFIEEKEGMTRYYSLFLLLVAGMFGLEFTGDAFNMFVFLEVTSIAACGLVGFNIDRGRSQEAAFKTLALYTVGALFFLFAVGILYGQYNALNFAYLASQLSYGFLDKVALTLFVVSLTMKAGSVPMHMWVPDAYAEAPSSISLVLVSNTLVSLYALYRILFNLFGMTLDQFTVGWVIIAMGAISVLVGVVMAFIQKELKRLMGYCALSQIGYMFLGLGVGLAVLGSPSLQEYGLTAIKGGLFHALNDAIYMGLLFLVAGAVIYRTGKRDMNELSGLAGSMKWTSVFALIGTGAIAGLPPFSGFASKLMIYESIFKFNPLLAVIAIVASIMTLAVFAKAFYTSFLGPQLPEFEEVREVPTSMLLAMGLLSAMIVFMGLFPNLVVDTVIEPAADALVNQADYVDAVMKLAGGA